MDIFLLLVVAFSIFQLYVVITANQTIIAKMKGLKAEGKDIKSIRQTISAEGYKKREITNAYMALSQGKILSVGNMLFSILLLVSNFFGITTLASSANQTARIVLILIVAAWIFFNMYIKSKNPFLQK